MIDQKNLPHVLSLVAEDCGLEEAFALASALGGERIYVPESPEDSTLADRVGPNVATSLSRHHPGEYVNIPQVSDRLRTIRREAWILAHPEASLNEIARELGMSRTGVTDMRRRMRQRGVSLPAGARRTRPRKHKTAAAKTQIELESSQ